MRTRRRNRELLDQFAPPIMDERTSLEIAQDQIATLTAQRDELLAALRDAREMLVDWSAYASEYYKIKHDYASDLDRIDAAIEKATK
jgi:hypothetical protein